MWRRSRSRSTFFHNSLHLIVLASDPACFITPHYSFAYLPHLSYLSHRPTYVEYLMEILIRCKAGMARHFEIWILLNCAMRINLGNHHRCAYKNKRPQFYEIAQLVRTRGKRASGAHLDIRKHFASCWLRCGTSSWLHMWHAW
jgi:hypothetical protein